MQKTKIEWTDYSYNPVKGLCPVACKLPNGQEYCYARRMYKRFKWNPEIRLDKKELLAPLKLKKPSRIFLCSTIELFHKQILIDWIHRILEIIKRCPQHTFIILTKCPENAIEWVFPDNVWLGVSVPINNLVGILRIGDLKDCQCDTKFVSFEPLLGPVDEMIRDFLNWVIVGGLTGFPTYPKHSQRWIDEIIKVADEKRIPIFIKPNANYPIKREEFPE